MDERIQVFIREEDLVRGAVTLEKLGDDVLSSITGITDEVLNTKITEHIGIVPIDGGMF